MTKQGWVAIYRKLTDHWLWSDKPFSKGQAWIDLLLLANHDDNEFLFGNQVVKVEQGSFITSELKLADRWGWGRKKVRCFLELLQNEQMLVKKGDNKKTTVTIVNYSVYADFGTAKEQQRNNRGTTEEHQRNTNNNDNNDNNVNNDNNRGVYQQVADMYNEICISLPRLKVLSDSRKKAIKARLKTYSLEQFRELFTKAEASDFLKGKNKKDWQANFDWLIKDGNFAKVLDGNYDNKKAKEARKGSLDEMLYDRMLSAIDEPPKTAAEDEGIRAKAEALKRQFAK